MELPLDATFLSSSEHLSFAVLDTIKAQRGLDDG